MRAREKLNIATAWGCLIVSAILGSMMGSWGSFWGTFLVLVAACHTAGGIRTHPCGPPPRGVRGGGGRRNPDRGR